MDSYNTIDVVFVLMITFMAINHLQIIKRPHDGVVEPLDFQHTEPTKSNEIVIENPKSLDTNHKCNICTNSN